MLTAKSGANTEEAQMTEALKIVEAERQKFKAALEEIGAMSMHRSGQAVVVAKKALLRGCCHALKTREVPRLGCCVIHPDEQNTCKLAEDFMWNGIDKSECAHWRKY